MKQHSRNSKKAVRPMSLHVSDKVAKAFRRGKIPKSQLPNSGIVAQTKQISRGDYQCNLAMSIHARYLRPLKASLLQTNASPEQPKAVPAAEETETKPSKKEKKTNAAPPTNTIFTIAATPHVFDATDSTTLPDTAHDLAYQTLSQLLDPRSQEIQNPNANTKNSADFISVDDGMLHGVSVTAQGFLGLKLSNKYISKRLVPFLVQNDAPPPLFYETDMKALTPHLNSTESHYDDRPLSLVSSSENGRSVPLPAYPRVVTIDYSSPNIAKEMHVGHIRSTCIGDSVAKLLEFSGYTIQRVNHLGDWGTQFGMLLCHYNDMKAAGVDLSNVDVADLASFYREAKQRFDKEPEFAKNAKEYVVKLQGGDTACLGVWREFCGLSRPSFQNIFSRLQIDPRLLERGESFYQPFLGDVIDELLTSGVAIERDGAILLPPPSFFEPAPPQPEGETLTPDGSEKTPKTPKTKKPQTDQDAGDGEEGEEDGGNENEMIADAIVLRKSDGGYAYGATDMAAIRLRLLGQDCWFNQSKHQPEWFKTDDRYKDGLEATLPTDWALYVVDSGQSVHFSNVFAGAERAGWIKKAQNIAQDRKMQYFNDILETISAESAGDGDQNTTPGKQPKRSIVRVAADGDQSDFARDVLNKTADATNAESDADVLDKPDLRVEHVQFGVVCGADGKRLRTRAGQQIKLVDLLDESVSRSKAVINQLTSARTTDPSSPESELSASAIRKNRRHQLLSQPEIQQQLAESVGYASIKYSDLSKNRISDYIFDFDTMLDMTGDTAGYLLYAHARLFSVLQRVGHPQEGSPRYANLIQKILTHKDPLGHFDRLVDYDFQHLQSADRQSPYDSLLDMMLHHPQLMKDFLGSDDQLDAQHSLLVSSTLAQYQSDYALDTTTVGYPRPRFTNDHLWSPPIPHLPQSQQQQRINPSYLSSITKNVSTIDPAYGISYASPIDKSQHDLYHQFPTIALDHQSERQLGLHIAQFHDALASSLASVAPHHMASYTYDLSTSFSNFYRDCTVNIKEGAEGAKAPPKPVGTKTEFNTQDSRVLLTQATTVTLQRCLDLIGIQPTKFM